VIAAQPTPAEVRASAARLVSQVIDRGRSLDELLAGDADEGSARGLKRSLCYGTLRWHFRLVEVLRRLCERPLDQMAPELRALLEVGLFQMLSGEVAPHAAVAETVGATRVLGHARASGFVNAVLRRFQREQEAVLADVDRDLAVRTAHPRWFVDMLRRDRPTSFESILDADNAHPPMWLRVNRTRTDPAAYAAELEAAGRRVTRHAYAPDALLIEPPTDVYSLPGFAEGLVSVQDAAAQLAVDVLGPQPGERLLDACAAPGGKTCHLLERVGGRADVTALDVSESRLGRVRENLERLGLKARVMAGDIARPQAWWDGRPFDRILLDVPCSATGVIRRHPDIKVLRRARDIPALAHRQADMLAAAWGLLRPGGTFLYTSCSVLRAEDEGVIEGFLASAGDATDLTAGRTGGWPDRAAAGPGRLVQSGEADMDGFYYACLGKAS
jgi:16S rRNA (cytosine967-C5)-methyltransferase